MFLSGDMVAWTHVGFPTGNAVSAIMSFILVPRLDSMGVNSFLSAVPQTFESRSFSYSAEGITAGKPPASLSRLTEAQLTRTKQTGTINHKII